MKITQDFAVQVDDSTKTPIFIQIVEQIKQGIASNQIQAGNRLPTVRQLARSLGINPGTVARKHKTHSKSISKLLSVFILLFRLPVMNVK